MENNKESKAISEQKSVRQNIFQKICQNKNTRQTIASSKTVQKSTHWYNGWLEWDLAWGKNDCKPFRDIALKTIIISLFDS